MNSLLQWPLAVLGIVLQLLVCSQISHSLYNPTPSERILGTAERNPIWGPNPAPPRGEHRLNQEIRSHTAHQLINFADPYKPERPLEHLRLFAYPSTGGKPNLKWLQWASKIAPHDIKTIRTECFWTFQIEGPDAATQAVQKALQNNPQNGLLLLELAFVTHYNPNSKHPLGKYSLATYEAHADWDGWDLADIAQLAQILFTESKRTTTNSEAIHTALLGTIQGLQHLRQTLGLPEVQYTNATTRLK